MKSGIENYISIFLVRNVFLNIAECSAVLSGCAVNLARIILVNVYSVADSSSCGRFNDLEAPRILGVVIVEVIVLNIVNVNVLCCTVRIVTGVDDASSGCTEVRRIAYIGMAMCIEKCANIRILVNKSCCFLKIFFSAEIVGCKEYILSVLISYGIRKPAGISRFGGICRSPL